MAGFLRLLRRFGDLFSKRPPRVHVGTDKFGNKYYEQAAANAPWGDESYQTWMQTRPRRSVEMAQQQSVNKFLVEYEPGALPVEWTRWLRNTRKRAPSKEEEAHLQRAREAIQENVARLEKEALQDTLASSLEKTKTVTVPDIDAIAVEHPESHTRGEFVPHSWSGHSKDCTPTMADKNKGTK